MDDDGGKYRPEHAYTVAEQTSMTCLELKHLRRRCPHKGSIAMPTAADRALSQCRITGKQIDTAPR